MKIHSKSNKNSHESIQSEAYTGAVEACFFPLGAKRGVAQAQGMAGCCQPDVVIYSRPSIPAINSPPCSP